MQIWKLFKNLFFALLVATFVSACSEENTDYPTEGKSVEATSMEDTPSLAPETQAMLDTLEAQLDKLVALEGDIDALAEVKTKFKEQFASIKTKVETIKVTEAKTAQESQAELAALMVLKKEVNDLIALGVKAKDLSDNIQETLAENATDSSDKKEETTEEMKEGEK